MVRAMTGRKNTAMDYIALLRNADLLRDVSESGLHEIGRCMEKVEATAGTTVFHKGDDGDAVYLIIDGILRLESDGVALMSRTGGEWVGEMALIDKVTRSASAIAQTDVRLLRWERESFVRVISHHPGVAYGIFKVLTRKLREDIERQVDLELEQERWKQDLKRAREIQMGMLPSGDLVTPRMEISGYCRPAAEVGGDYYDYVEFDDARVGVIIGDVTGHGFYAGLFVAMAKSGMNTQAQIDHAPRKIMEAMRRTVSLSIQRSLLMTCCYVLFNADNGKLGFSNAGHPYPYHYRRRSESLERLCPMDPLLGVQDLYDASFQESELDWEPGDLMLFYSDGITEARDVNGKMFEHERLEDCFIENKEKKPAQIKEAILTRLEQHCNGQPYDDDLTLVVVKAL